MRTRPIALLVWLACACGPSEVSVEEAARSGANVGEAAAAELVVPVDLGEGLMLAVESRGAGDFVRAGGRVRVHYRARVASVLAVVPPTEPAATEPAVGEPAPETVEEAATAALEPDAEVAAPAAEAPTEVQAEAAPAEATPAEATPAEVAPAEAAPQDAALPELGEPAWFDSSWARGVPDVWELSNTAKPRLIEGLRRGLVGLTAGSRVTLRVPAALAWGDEGLTAAGVPPGAEVFYEIEILEVLP